MTGNMSSRSTRRRNTHRSAPYDTTNINNWYSDQFRTKLLEWGITATANYTKAELKSLYMANLQHRSEQNEDNQSNGSSTRQPNEINQTPQATENIVSVSSQQESSESLLVSVLNPVTSLIKEASRKGDNEDVCQKTLDKYNSLNTNGMQASDMVNANSSSTYGIHPESLKNIDYVTESICEKIQSGKYVNLACLLIPEHELVSEEKKLEKQKDMRLNHSLTIEEFILAFNKYKRIHCARHAWRKPELDAYELIFIEISAVYGPKVYEYHKLFAQKCAAALTMGQKLNWAEKDKDLLQMIIGGVPSKVCQICKEVSHTSAFCPSNTYVNHPYQRYGKDHGTVLYKKPELCRYFNGTIGCKAPDSHFVSIFFIL